MPHKIQSVAFLPGRSLLLHYGGGEVVIDFNPLIKRGGIFARLADDTYWSQVQVGEDGRSLDWPPVTDDPITALDLDADALWFEAHPDDYARYLASIQAADEVLTQ